MKNKINETENLIALLIAAGNLIGGLFWLGYFIQNRSILGIIMAITMIMSFIILLRFLNPFIRYIDEDNPT